MSAQFAASIQTIPFLPDNTTAREFVNLQVVSVYNSSGYSYCRWSFNGLFHHQPEEMFDKYDGELICEDRKFDGNFYIKCVEENRIINTTLTIVAPLQYTANITTECTFGFRRRAYSTQTRIELRVASKL